MNCGNGSSGSLRGTGQANDGQTKRVESTSTLLSIMQTCYNRPPVMSYFKSVTDISEFNSNAG